MTKSEAKFHNTANKMNNALFKLINEKPFQDISVSEICSLAGVNRSTFYSHYQNTVELLQETHKKYMNEFFSNFDFDLQNENLSTFQVENFVSERFIIPYLKFIKKNKKIHKLYINNLTIFNLDEFYNIILENLWVPACKKKGITNLTIINYMSKYYLTGMTAIINEWVNNNCEEDINLIYEIIVLCVRPEKI